VQETFFEIYIYKPTIHTACTITTTITTTTTTTTTITTTTTTRSGGVALVNPFFEKILKMFESGGLKTELFALRDARQPP
jgi:hypothetical protein